MNNNELNNNDMLNNQGLPIEPEIISQNIDTVPQQSVIIPIEQPIINAVPQVIENTVQEIPVVPEVSVPIESQTIETIQEVPIVTEVPVQLEPQTIESNIQEVPVIPEMPVPVPLDNIVVPEPVVLNQQPIIPNQVSVPIIQEQYPQAGNMNNNIPQNKNKKLMPAILIVLILLVAAVLVYIFIINKDDKSNNNSNSNNSNSNNSNSNNDDNDIDSGYEWDPSTSKIVEIKEPNTIKLTCKQSSEQQDMKDESTVIYIFKDDVFLQAIIEEELIFTKSSIKYYEYYLGEALEDLEKETGKYDNMILEIRKKKESISYVYSIDMTADPENPNNLLNSNSLTYDQAKLKLENDKYVCE